MAQVCSTISTETKPNSKRTVFGYLLQLVTSSVIAIYNLYMFRQTEL